MDELMEKRREQKRVENRRSRARMRAQGLVQLLTYLTPETKDVFDLIKGRLGKTIPETASDMVAFYRDARKVCPLCVPLESKERPGVDGISSKQYHHRMTAKGFRMIHMYTDKNTKETINLLREELGLNTAELFEDMVCRYYKALR